MGAAKDQWVLVVDDEEDVRELLVDDLIDRFEGNLRIVEAADGVQATSKLDFQEFDCIVTDLQMPKRDGEHFIEWVRESNLNKNTPIVVVTGYPDSDLSSRYPNIHFLNKPVNFDEFGQLIKTQLKLGKIDKRMSADLFNYTVNATRMFFGKVLEAVPTNHAAITKNPGEDIEGQHLVISSVKGPFGKCDIAIGYDELILKAIVGENSKKSSESLAVAASATILGQMLNKYHKDNSKQRVPKIQHKSYVKDRSGYVFESMKKSSGMKVPITVGDLTVTLTLLTNMPKL